MRDDGRADAAAVDELDDPGPLEQESRPARPPRPVGFAVAAALAVVFFASTVLLAVVAVGLKSDKDDLVDDRTAVQAAAGRFVDAFLQFDYRDPDGSVEAVVALTAPPFTEQFEEAIPALQEAFETSQQVSTGTVRDVFVADVAADGSAIAIAVYDRQLDGVGGPRRETNRYLRLGLVERDGEWRVNEVIDLNLAFSEAGSQTPTTG